MNKILLVLFSLFFVSACSINQPKSEIQPQVDEIQVEETQVENLSDDELLNELNTSDPSIDEDLKSLETELSN